MVWESCSAICLFSYYITIYPFVSLRFHETDNEAKKDPGIGKPGSITISVELKSWAQNFSTVLSS